MLFISVAIQHSRNIDNLIITLIKNASVIFARGLKYKLLIKHIFQHIPIAVFSYGNPFSLNSFLTHMHVASGMN